MGTSVDTEDTDGTGTPAADTIIPDEPRKKE